MQGSTAISKWCAKDLFLSEDFARTWSNLTERSAGRIASVWDFEWGASLHRKMDDPFPDTTIFATVYESAAKMKGPYPGCPPPSPCPLAAPVAVAVMYLDGGEREPRALATRR